MSSPPSGLDAMKQKEWDTPVVQGHFATLLAGTDAKSRARLLAAKRKIVPG